MEMYTSIRNYFCSLLHNLSPGFHKHSSGSRLSSGDTYSGELRSPHDVVMWENTSNQKFAQFHVGAKPTPKCFMKAIFASFIFVVFTSRK